MITTIVLFGAYGNLRTKILDFRGIDSSIILNLRGVILMSRGNFPEALSQQNLRRDNLSIRRLGVGNFTSQDFDISLRAESTSRQISAILVGHFTMEMTVSANLRNSPQNFHDNCRDKCQKPGLQNSLPEGIFWKSCFSV